MNEKKGIGNNGISIIGVIPEYPRHSQFNIFAKILMPPVGIVSVFTQIKDMPQINSVYIIDENNYAGPRNHLGFVDHNFLQKQQPADIAMFYGGMSNSILRMYSLAKEYQRRGVVTIAGGSHVDALPKEALSRGIDIVVHGEGEIVAREILEEIIQNGEVVLDKSRFFGIKGISYLSDSGEYVFTGKRDSIVDLDSLKDPDLTLIKYIKKRWSAIPISKGRGCNWNCEFCIVNKQYGAYKYASVDKVFRQIVRYSDMGYKEFFIVDDNFAQIPSETIELCNRLGDYERKFRKKINITDQIRNEAAENDELILAMKYGGVTTHCIGIESPIDEDLKAMRKGVTVEKLVRRIKKLSEHFYIHGMFIFGYPEVVGSDLSKKNSMPIEEKAKRYLKFFKDSRIDTIQVLNAVPLPGSEIRARLEREKRLISLETADWDKYDGLFLCYDPTPEGIDPYDLQYMPKMLMKKKYLGDFVSRKVNYGNWMNWAYYASIGFPIQFGMFYSKRFFHNLIESNREKRILHESEQDKNIFHKSLDNTWTDIKRRWRNLAVKTYAGDIVRNWMKEYRGSDYTKKFKTFFSKKEHVV